MSMTSVGLPPTSQSGWNTWPGLIIVPPGWHNRKPRKAVADRNTQPGIRIVPLGWHNRETNWPRPGSAPTGALHASQCLGDRMGTTHYCWRLDGWVICLPYAYGYVVATPCIGILDIEVDRGRKGRVSSTTLLLASRCVQKGAYKPHRHVV